MEKEEEQNLKERGHQITSPTAASGILWGWVYICRHITVFLMHVSHCTALLKAACGMDHLGSSGGGFYCQSYTIASLEESWVKENELVGKGEQRAVLQKNETIW